MEINYNLLLKQYNKLITILEIDHREVSKEMIQVIHDDIEDIMIELGKASQIQPKLDKSSIGFEIENS